MQCSARLSSVASPSCHRTYAQNVPPYAALQYFHLVQIVWTARDPAGSWLAFKPIL